MLPRDYFGRWWRKERTNGSAISEKLISFFHKLNITLSIPIYSYKDNYHDYFTGIQGSFRETIKNIKILNKKGVHVVPIIYISDKNYADLEKIIEFVTCFKCSSYRIDFIYPKIDKPEKIASIKNFMSIYNHIRKMLKIDYELYLTNRRINQCLFGKIAITLNGDIIPCQNARSQVIENIFSDNITLSEILKKGLLDNFWYLTKDKIEICRKCEYRYGCIDCPILTHEFTEGTISKNLFCAYSPLEGVWTNEKFYA